jgi:hypothetical protein
MRKPLLFAHSDLAYLLMLFAGIARAGASIQWTAIVADVAEKPG